MTAHTLIVNSSIAEGLDVIGDRWSLLILRDAFLGRRRFEEFRRYTGASKATLARRLTALINQGVMTKVNAPGAAKRMEYRLTEMGAALFPSSMLAWQWELEWLDAGASGSLPYQLIHRRCGQPLKPSPVCAGCEMPFQLNEMRLPHADQNPAPHIEEIKSLSGQRRVRSSATKDGEDLNLAGISDLIGDRWTLLILISAFFGVRRHDVFLKQLNIASNILSHRLTLLLDNGVFERRTYQASPPRNEYFLSHKGLSLFPLIIALRQWAVAWEENPAAVTALQHSPCGEVLSVRVKCEACHELIERHEVDYI
jgi:DNA-binding HxlR family transcriptional regulator